MRATQLRSQRWYGRKLALKPVTKSAGTSTRTGISQSNYKQQYGAFSQLEPVDLGEPTNAAEDHDLVAGDY